MVYISFYGPHLVTIIKSPEPYKAEKFMSLVVLLTSKTDTSATSCDREANMLDLFAGRHN